MGEYNPGYKVVLKYISKERNKVSIEHYARGMEQVEKFIRSIIAADMTDCSYITDIIIEKTSVPVVAAP